MFSLKFRTLATVPIVVLTASVLAGCGGGGSTSLPSMTQNQSNSANSTVTGKSGPNTGRRSAKGTQTAIGTAYSSAVLASAPVAYYQLNDTTPTLTDSGPNAANGTYGSAVSENLAPITQGSTGAAGFPGGTTYNPNGFAFTAQNASLQPATLSLEAWINVNAMTPANTYVPIAVYGNKGNTYGLFLQGKGNNVQTLYYQQTNSGVSSRLLLHGSAHINIGTTYHVVAVFDGTNVTTYVNGLSDVSASYPGVIGYPATAPVGLQIGGELSSGTGDASFPGTIAQVALYGAPLNASTVTAHYLAGQPIVMTSETATPADGFVDSIGINTHFADSSDLYATSFPQVKSLLGASGIRHFRDNMSFSPAFISSVQQLAALNIHGDFVVNSMQYTQSQVQGYPALVSPSLESFEAPNEQDDQGVTNWQQPCIAFQQTLYSWVKGNSATAGYPVLGPALAYASDYSQLGNLSASLDYGNFHGYMGAYNPGFAGGPYGGVKAMLGMEQATSGTKPVISTESGFGTIVQSPGLDYPTDLRYVTRTYFEQFNAGIARSYIYELIDEPTTANPFATFGLLTNTLTAKPAFTGVQSLIAALQDPGTTFQPAALAYNLSGLSTVHHLLLQKRNGQFILALWQEVPGWNVNGGGAITVPVQNVTLTTAKNFSSVSLSSMSETGTLSTAPLTWSNQQTTIPVSDKISLVTLTP